MIKSVEIESAGADVIDDVMVIMNSAFPIEYGEAWNHSQCLSMLLMPNSKLLIARNDQQIVGFALSRVAADEEELLLFAVLPENRGFGIGRRLIEQFINNAKNNGAIRLFLEARANNSVQNLYLKYDFILCGKRKNYYSGSDGQKFDAHTYKKSLF